MRIRLPNYSKPYIFEKGSHADDVDCVGWSYYQCCEIALLIADVNEIEDHTRVVISYEIYETSLWRVSCISYEMTMSVSFCVSYDLLIWDFIAFKMNIISMRERIVDTDVVNDVT